MPVEEFASARALKEQRAVHNVEIGVVKEDGNVIWTSVSAAPVAFPDWKVVIVTSDISERKRMENTLRESEKRLRTLFQKSPLGIGLEDFESRFIDANEALCAMLGYTKEELLGKTVLDITHPDDRAMSTTLLEYMITGSNRGYSTQKRYIRKHGSSLWVNVTTAPVTNSAGVFTYGISLVEDITERKWAEENIRRQNLELTFLNQIGQVFNRLMPPSEIVELLYSSIGQVLDNRSLYIALYDETSQSISFPIYTIKGKHRGPFSRPFGNGLTEYILHTKELLLIPHDQEAFLAEHHIDAVGEMLMSFLGVPMRVGNEVLGVIALQDYEREDAYQAGDVELLGTIARQVAIALENSRLYGEVQRELNERKQAEHALRESRDRLAHLSHRLVQVQEQERRHIAFELHDEVGQTLAALSMALEGVTQATKDAAVREKTAGLKDLVRSLINQVSALSMELHPRDLDALGLVPALIALFRRISTQTGIEVDFKHSAFRKRRLTPEIEISAYRIIQEALTNVIRHSGVKIANIRLQLDGDSLWIQVQDEGQGFDFQKELNDQDSLGLLSMTERAKQIGGRLSIETAPGEGVLVTCTLPLR